MTRRRGVGVFGSVLLRHEGVRGFGFGIECSGVIQMTRGGRRQVGIGRIGVGTVTVVTPAKAIYSVFTPYTPATITVYLSTHTSLRDTTDKKTQNGQLLSVRRLSKELQWEMLKNLTHW